MGKLLLILLVIFLCSESAFCFCFEEAGNEYGISPHLLWSIAKHESGMNPQAVGRNSNGTYDYGLMQINSSWAKVLGSKVWMRLGEPCTNVRTGAWILAQCIQRHGYNWKAVGCYNSNTPGKREKYAKQIANVVKHSIPASTRQFSADAGAVPAEAEPDPWRESFEGGVQFQHSDSDIQGLAFRGSSEHPGE